MNIVEMKNITKSFGSGLSKVEAIKNVQFTAAGGELLAVVGPSGSGKSTFLEIIGGLLTPDSGILTIDGQNYHDLSGNQMEKMRLDKIGFILQGYNLVPYLTIREQFELVEHIKRTPNMDRSAFAEVLDGLDIDTILDKYPADLSGGQRQRAAIARAIYVDPKLILADEPTASLDSQRAFEVMKIFKDLTRLTGKTVIVVTHDTRLEKFVDQIYTITDGILQQGKVKED